MGPQRRKRMHHSIRDVSRAARTRARTKDLDQIHDDLKAPEKLLSQPEDADLPGLGQHYCLQCARYFTTAAALDAHLQTKLHKKRLKRLKEEPYTQKEAEAAAGLGTDNNRRPAVEVGLSDVAMRT
ncbi:hypothetical protein DFJ73DRAFT_834451 [Zopfochytrium polystomum]|nr:hypothetical protein DFJ73DRAFT_834451 [Zopfochytrium polystomum]